ncbi:MAG: peptidylprolyl isomerase [Saprospiraceae bacterium]|nr:peptidylprolyl isomerase [Saprospiraceae bacterium]
MNRLLIFLSFLVSFTACVPFEEQVLTEVNLKLDDPVFQKIRNFQDQGLVDSLYPYFRHDDPSYRYAAANAFASIQDSTALDSLAWLLKDRIDMVREAAAFAIGQTGTLKGEVLLMQAFDQADTAGLFKNANAAILEAIGKCGTESMLENLTSISTYTPTDTTLLLGQCYGVYRFGLRNVYTQKGTDLMVRYVSQDKYPAEVRLVAANYLYRTPELNLTPHAEVLVTAFTKEKDPNIRMALAIAIGKTKSDIARDALTGLLGAEQDYRVQCNMIRALANFDYTTVKEAVQAALKNNNQHVAKVAAQFFRNSGTAEDGRFYYDWAQDSVSPYIKLQLLAAAQKYLPNYFEATKGQINYEARRIFENTNDPYLAAAALDALSEFGWNFRYIIEKSTISDFPIVRTAGIRALSTICSNENFDQFFGLGSKTVKREIALSLKEGINNGDPGIIAEGAILLRDPKMEFGQFFDSLTFMQNALTKLSLPKEIESYNELNKTYAFLSGQPEPAPQAIAFNHPINWDILLTTGQTATIKTDKGEIEITFYPTVAPGSVSNFYTLAKDGFFNGKNFHRVVPNFVIQGGCPRGDGYGSLDYTIRSEFSDLHYNEGGYMGMASAGKHTEGTQFFITHSPTLHLDGRYTIFGKVSKGMDVVHKIMEGDKITAVTLN